MADPFQGSHEDTKMLRSNELERAARIVVDCGYRIHQELGPGLLESAYEALLASATRQAGLSVERQVPITMAYRGVVVDNAFKIDLLVEKTLIVELKSIERLAPVHSKQVLTYLRLMRLPLGLLINFNQATFKAGLRRIANDYYGHFRLAPASSCLRVNPATVPPKKPLSYSQSPVPP